MSQMTKKRGRAFHYHDRDWQWKFGEPLLIWDDHDKRHEIRLSQLLGYNPDREMEKGNFSFRPAWVRVAIDRFILGYDDRHGFPKGVIPEDHVEKHRHGYDLLQGPRGRWQMKVDGVICRFISPEGFEHECLAEGVLGGEWKEAYDRAIHDAARQIPAEVLSRDRDEWFRRLRELTVVPKLNFNSARQYLRENFGPVE